VSTRRLLPIVLGLAGLLALSPAALPAANAAELDDDIFTMVLVDRLEYRVQDGSDVIFWDGFVRAGTDENKVAVRAEGEFIPDSGTLEEAEFWGLYQRLISDFFDAQIGVRHDIRPNPSRTYAVLGLSGLAPQWFEVSANAFLSDEGDPSARMEAEYDLPITQRLILQPRAEVNVAFAEDEEIGVGSGLNDFELGLRLRYEIEREFAPYIGVNWLRKVGDTQDFAREEGEDTDVLSFVAGVRIFF